MLLGTTDGGSSWSKVTFSVPDGAPNYDGQSYLSIGFITCPTSNVCVANGSTAQGSPTAPIYSLTQRGTGTKLTRRRSNYVSTRPTLPSAGRVASGLR